MLPCFITSTSDTPLHAVPIIFLTAAQFPGWRETQSSLIKNWITLHNFKATSHTFCLIPSETGQLDKVLVGKKDENDVFYMGALASILPKGIYYLESFHPLAALAWGMGAYQFTKYKTTALSSKPVNQLILPYKKNSPEYKLLHSQLEAIYLVRNLINTPAEDMTPETLSIETKKLAQQFNAEYTEIIGEDLLSHNYPAIYAVGRASTNAPRVIDLRWGDKNAPKITLAGKGVCFDSGGLNLKNMQAMALMKKDMGGAAHVLGLASLIMQMQLPVYLRILIPAVENVVGGNAYKPGDIIRTRKGMTVEIGNTDAEGRVVLADVLYEASTEHPELLIDIATLTGASKIALGTDLPALFTDNDTLAQELSEIGQAIQDPLWRMPLHMPYRKLLDSSVADINNMGSSGYAGAITAALFLKEFVGTTNWAHFDIMAWNVSSSPSHPEGGEAVIIRTLFQYLQERFGS